MNIENPRVAIIGLGFGAEFIPIYQRHPNAEIVALCQRNGEVEVYRDDNKDQILDFDDVTKEWGYFGINIHRSNPSTESTIVEKWSAGCQVFKKIADYNEFLDKDN